MVPLTQSSMERGLDDWKGGKAMATKELSYFLMANSDSACLPIV